MKGIPIVNRKGCGIILLDDIEYIECSYRKAVIRTGSGRYEVYLTPDEIDSFLDDRFDRCTHTLFVNHDKVRYMADDTINFFSGEKLMLGRKSFLRAKKEYIIYIRNLQKTLANSHAL